MLLWVFFCCWAALLIGTAGAQTCRYTGDTLPHPRIVLLGPTGVGKSTFGNRLFNTSQHNQNEAVCPEEGRWTRDETTGEDVSVAHFGVGHGSESFTTSTSWMVGHYLGDPANPLITVIDTPGTGNTDGRDCEHGIALAEKIKRIGSVDAFILFKGANPRFTQPMEDQIKLLVSIFGEEMWQNTITEFSFWRHDRRSILDRERSQGNLNEVTQHNNWNKEYKERFGVSQTIPSVFIDPVYDEELADNTEKEIDEKNTNKLWNLLKNLTTFQCKERCQAPSGFFTGQPWLIPENTVQNKRLGDRTVITWQIWFSSCDGSGTTSYNLSHVDQNNTTRMLYQHFNNNTTRSERSSLRILDVPNEKFKTIQLIIESTEEEHYGSYFVENSKERSQLGELRKIMDGEWEEWSRFSPCSKTCMISLEQPGLMQRERTCKLPQNGGQPCRGKSTEKTTCAPQIGVCPESVLLITGGYGSRTTVEVFPSTSSCWLKLLPDARAKHTTFLTSEPNPVLATCEGYALASCLVLDKFSGHWNQNRMGDLTMPREFSTVATLNSVGVFIIGGNADNNSKTSDFLAADSMQWEEGPALPVDMRAPCAISISPTSFLAIDGNRIHEFDTDLAGPTSMNGWREAGRWPRLKTTRWSWPGCAKLGQKVIIAGGVKSAEFLSSTEVLDLGSREITTGGDLATPRTYFHLATIIRGGQEKVYAVAGQGDPEGHELNTVEEWVEASSTWKAADNLPQKKMLFGAVTVARSYVCPA